MKDTDTADLNFVREYPVTLDRLWRAVTEPVQLIQWFGPEGVYIETAQLDFTRKGPWMCRMLGKESGHVYKVSGQVTSIRPPANGKATVGFTWAWHDDDDQRGHESHVTFEVEQTGKGARLTLIHLALDSVDAAQGHSRGWLSTFAKLDYFLDPEAGHAR
jgi:uncharacterized protein YndB with AHSA1/START domain